MTASYRVEKTHFGEWCCNFLVNGCRDNSAHGTDGTGLKLYQTEEKAVAAGKRYLKKMKQNGFTV